jgi:hypothetical protein
MIYFYKCWNDFSILPSYRNDCHLLSCFVKIQLINCFSNKNNVKVRTRNKFYLYIKKKKESEQKIINWKSSEIIFMNEKKKIRLILFYKNNKSQNMKSHWRISFHWTIAFFFSMTITTNDMPKKEIYIY